MLMTPMMKQWQEIKSKHTDCIVFFRLGDFYEMFFEDAKVASQALGITLTSRECGMPERAPMCGVPHHAAGTYVKKLIEKDFRVAMCEQVTAPTKGMMVEREVVKIITAGTYNDESFLDAQKNNFIASIYTAGESASISWCDVTTGEFFAINTKTENIDDIKGMIRPNEIIDSNGHYGYAFASGNAYSTILRYFNITSTKIFDLEKDDKIINSAGALLHYLNVIGKKTFVNITKISVVKNGEFMTIDKIARDNLEITNVFRNPTQKKGSLLWVLDETVTPMGGREIASWVTKPLQSIPAMNQRFDALQALIDESNVLRGLKTALSNISDISRLCGKVASGDLTPRELLAIARSLEQVGKVKQILKTPIAGGDTPLSKGGILDDCHNNLILLPELCESINRAIIDTPPVKIDDGGFIRDGFDKRLDNLRAAAKHGRDWLNKLEQTERLETQIKELKVSYNRVTGYYFEIPLRLNATVPYRFTRKGSTASTERFTTPELKEIEEKIVNSHSDGILLEGEILKNLCKYVLDNVQTILNNAKQIAILDAIQSLANVAIQNGYVRPTLNNKGKISLKNARHPVIEKLVGRSNFIANDCELDRSTMLITGPNMAGKSTFMRMIAHVVLMAHVGSFVPAAAADIALTDRVFTRIGASDSMLTGESTFMVEMNEVSNIVHNATANSLVLLDEVGRGTGTSDGLSLANAIVKYITDKIGANTMFATHFHELTDLASGNPKIKNYKMLTEQINNEIVFLHRVEPGIEQNSFGIEVAKLAGLPKTIIDEARKSYKPR